MGKSNINTTFFRNLKVNKKNVAVVVRSSSIVWGEHAAMKKEVWKVSSGLRKSTYGSGRLVDEYLWEMLELVQHKIDLLGCKKPLKFSWLL